MSKTNIVHPAGTPPPITSQPSSRVNSAHPSADGNNENDSKPASPSPSQKNNGDGTQDDGGVLLPTPRRFLTPKDCPPGLENLAEPQYIFLKQCFSSIEGMGIEHFPEDAAKYEILSVLGDRIFVAVEKKESATGVSKMFCTASTPFALCVFSKTSETHYRKEVLQVSGHPGSFGCGAEMEVKYDNKKLGKVEQDSDFSILRYTISNGEGKEVLKIIGPKHGSCCSISMGKVLIHEFDIFLADGHTHVGRIAKHWSGVPNNKDVFTRSDIWGVKFPEEYDVKLKALLLSTCFLMFYQFSERRGSH